MKIEFAADFDRTAKAGNLGMGVVFLSQNSICRVIDYWGLVDIGNITPCEIVVFDLTNTRLRTIYVDEVVIPLDCTLKVNGRLEGDE